VAKSAKDKFWTYVNVKGQDECWEWNRSRNKQGYGNFYKPGYRHLPERAHRFSYRTEKGEIPPGIQVCHTCDNPPCVNPKHLFLGTAKENKADSIRKGRLRVPIGINCHQSKLTENSVRSIRNLYETQKTPHRKIAEMFGVTKTVITSILSGRSWKHVK
jgi:hypothetical protein